MTEKGIVHADSKLASVPTRAIHLAAAILSGDRAVTVSKVDELMLVEMGTGNNTNVVEQFRDRVVGRVVGKSEAITIKTMGDVPPWRRLANAIANLQEIATSNDFMSRVDRALFCNALAMHYAKIGAEIEATGQSGGDEAAIDAALSAQFEAKLIAAMPAAQRFRYLESRMESLAKMAASAEAEIKPEDMQGPIE